MADTEEKTKQKKDRSVAYPGITLSDAIESTQKLRDSLGRGPYSREEAAKALGHSQLTGPAARKVAALVHYGLLERSGNTYSQSQLAQDILKPLSDEQKETSIRRAAVAPRLFQKLCQRFDGQALPSMLQNILMREGISEGAASEVARIFTETMRFANLLVNGVITNVSTAEVSETGEDAAARISPPGSVGGTHIKPPAHRAIGGDAFVFEFSGGIQLVIPNTKETSEAIADGELKEARQKLSDFAGRFMSTKTAAQSQESDTPDTQ